MTETKKNKAAEAFADLCKTIAALRHPETGCPWDIKQSHETLQPYMLEEAYEAVQVMKADGKQELCDELGDVLLQVVLNAQVASDDGRFDIVDVVKNIDQKMIRRHPHVFKDDESNKISIDQLHSQWQKIKDEEKSSGQKPPEENNYFVKKEVYKVRPSTSQAVKIGKLAKKIGFDWRQTDEVWQVLKSEVDEVEQELKKDPQDKTRIAEELGDLYFCLAQLCRHLDLDAEIVSQQGNEKFLNRFQKLEKIAQEKSISVEEASTDTLEGLWLEVKKRET